MPNCIPVQVEIHQQGVVPAMAEIPAAVPSLRVVAAMTMGSGRGNAAVAEVANIALDGA
jgi:hypothetical protein